jgi:hypothetical protein
MTHSRSPVFFSGTHLHWEAKMMNARSMAVLSLVALTTLGFAVVSLGLANAPQQPGKKEPNMMQQPPRDVKDSEKVVAIQNLELANKLIHYGRQEKNAEALLVAAQILHKTPTQPLMVGYDIKGEKEGKRPAGGFEGVNPKALVVEARKMSSTPHLESLAMATEKMLQEATRGAAGGPRRDYCTIRPGETITWRPIDFRANEKAVVDIEIFNHGVMTLEVIDQNGHVIARDNVPGHFYNCAWYPAWTGPFVIRLTNQDRMPFNIDFVTN